jgi:hypothetical protein
MTPQQLAQLEALRKPTFAGPGQVIQNQQNPQIGGASIGIRAPVADPTNEGSGFGNMPTIPQPGGGGAPVVSSADKLQAYIDALRASSTPFESGVNYPDDELAQLPGSPDYNPFDPNAPGVKPREEVTVGENEIVHGPLPPGYEYTKPPTYQEGDEGTYTGTGSYNGQDKQLTCGPNQYFAQGPTGPMCLDKKNYGDPINAKTGNYNVLEYGKSIDGGGDQEAVYQQMARSAINSGLDINTLAQQAGVTYEQAKQFLDTYG